MRKKLWKKTIVAKVAIDNKSGRDENTEIRPFHREKNEGSKINRDAGKEHDDELRNDR
jgi:hypothetical protein